MKQQTLEHYWLYKQRYLLSTVTLTAIVGLALSMQLGSLAGGPHDLEIATALQPFGLENPLNPLHRGLQHLSLWLFGHTAFALRLPSVLMGVGATALLAGLLNRLYWPRLALIGTFLFATSSWFLHFARFGSTAIEFIFMLLLILYTSQLALHSQRHRWRVVAGIILAVSLYTPYMLYVSVFLFALYARELRRMMHYARRYQHILFTTAMATLLGPLVYAISKDLSLLKTLAGIPPILPSPLAYATNVSRALGHMFWQSREFPGLHLGTLAMLDIFTASMAALGLYHFEQSWPSKRAKTVIGLAIVLILVAGLQPNDDSFAMTMPLIYILATAGISVLIQQWYEIFPRNPIARVVAVFPIALLLTVVFEYHYHRYFVAWPRTPEVQAVFHDELASIRTDLLERPDSERILLIDHTASVERLTFIASDSPAEATKVIDAADVSRADLQSYDTIYVGEEIMFGKEIEELFPESYHPVSTATSKSATAFRRYDMHLVQ